MVAQRNAFLKLGEKSMKNKKKAVSAAIFMFAAGLLGFFAIGQTETAPAKAEPQDIPFGAWAPEQPIPYSHKLHAGELQIDCQYCHSLARRGRTAGIPALEQCMACHVVIKPTSPLIQQIAQAYENKQPIEWVKVHDLPHFVYFSHKRHIKAGFECQDCHGPVEEMEVLYRHAPLTMGWCVNCHRDNYDKGAQDDCLVCHM